MAPGAPGPHGRRVIDSTVLQIVARVGGSRGSRAIRRAELLHPQQQCAWSRGRARSGAARGSTTRRTSATACAGQLRPGRRRRPRRRGRAAPASGGAAGAPARSKCRKRARRPEASHRHAATGVAAEPARPPAAPSPTRSRGTRGRCTPERLITGNASPPHTTHAPSSPRSSASSAPASTSIERQPAGDRPGRQIEEGGHRSEPPEDADDPPHHVDLVGEERLEGRRSRDRAGRADRHGAGA